MINKNQICSDAQAMVVGSVLKNSKMITIKNDVGVNPVKSRVAVDTYDTCSIGCS